MASYVFNIRGAWEVADDQSREFDTEGAARREAAALMDRLQGDYPEAYWIGKPWRIEISSATGEVVAVVDAPVSQA